MANRSRGHGSARFRNMRTDRYVKSGKRWTIRLVKMLGLQGWMKAGTSPCQIQLHRLAWIPKNVAGSSSNSRIHRNRFPLISVGSDYAGGFDDRRGVHEIVLHCIDGGFARKVSDGFRWENLPYLTMLRDPIRYRTVYEYELPICFGACHRELMAGKLALQRELPFYRKIMPLWCVNRGGWWKVIP